MGARTLPCSAPSAHSTNRNAIGAAVVPRPLSVLLPLPPTAARCYAGTEKELTGTSEDAALFSQFLQEDLAVPAENITLMDQSGDRPPTAGGIRKALNWYIGKAAEGDSLLLYFAGHGTSVRPPLPPLDPPLWTPLQLWQLPLLCRCSSCTHARLATNPRTPHTPSSGSVSGAALHGCVAVCVLHTSTCTPLPACASQA